MKACSRGKHLLQMSLEQKEVLNEVTGEFQYVHCESISSEECSGPSENLLNQELTPSDSYSEELSDYLQNECLLEHSDNRSDDYNEAFILDDTNGLFLNMNVEVTEEIGLEECVLGEVTTEPHFGKNHDTVDEYPEAEYLLSENEGSTDIIDVAANELLVNNADSSDLHGMNILEGVTSSTTKTRLRHERNSMSTEDFQDSGSEYLPSDHNDCADDSDFTLTRQIEDSSDEVQLDPCTGLFVRIPSGPKMKRRSKGQANSLTWKRKKESMARLQGKDYTGYQKDADGKYKQTAPKPAKQMKRRCNGHNGHPSCSRGGPQQHFQCDIITEEDREHLFKYFLNLQTWDARKEYVRGLVEHGLPKHRRVNSTDAASRKNCGFKYYLNLRTNNTTKRLHVCKVMFTSTLAVGYRQLRDWVLKSVTQTRDVPMDETQPSNDINETAAAPVTESITKRHLIEFLDSLPKVESHYCRASSSKLYLEPTWESYRHIHREFQKYCEREDKRACSWRYFMLIFRSQNLEIYSPRKDQCNKCTAFKNGNLPQQEFDNHQSKKSQAREEKQNDKDNSDDHTLVYTVDVQAVLLSPKLQASAYYYKTKLKVHNYTVYNMKNKDVTCYVWHEGNGGLDSDVFTSLLVKHLQNEIDMHKPKNIIVWSDGCSYQNRCINMANGLLELAVREQVTIYQKYLEVGHTQMEVDSIHSTIERKLPRRREIFVPADYINIIKSARKDPAPYKVTFLTYNDFTNFSGGRYTSIRPGSKKGDPVVADIVSLQYLPEASIKYKLSFTDNYNDLPRRASNRPFVRPKLYQHSLPIDATKFRHLQEMKSVIPSDYHSFYNNLKHGCTNPDNCPHIIQI